MNKKNKSQYQHFKDFLFFPLRAFILSEPLQRKVGLTTLKDERFSKVAKVCKGYTLDLGCGMNEFIKSHYTGKGIGVDVFPFNGVDLIVEDSTNLPFSNQQFDTVTLIGCLNHIPPSIRVDVLKELHRVLNDEGQLIITMINRFIGIVTHKLTWWDFDQNVRGMSEEEDPGLNMTEINKLLAESGFKIHLKKKFIYNMNNLIIARKIDS